MASDSLRYINAIIGFCNRLESWPHPLSDLGYVPCGVERDVKVLLDGEIGNVRVDLICASPPLDHAFCAETKSRTIDDKQAKRYSVMTPANLRDTANLPPEVDPHRLSHDVIYISSRDNAEAVAAELGTISVSIPVLAADDTEFKLHSGSVSQSDLHRLLAGGIPVVVAPEAWPLSFVPFIAQSPLPDIVAAVALSLSYYIIRGEAFEVEAFAQRTVQTWTWYGNNEQRSLRKTFADLIDDARRNELADYYERTGTPRAWTVKKGRLTKPSQLQALTRLTTEFVDRIVNETPTQTTLPEDFLDALVKKPRNAGREPLNPN